MKDQVQGRLDVLEKDRVGMQQRADYLRRRSSADRELDADLYAAAQMEADLGNAPVQVEPVNNGNAIDTHGLLQDENGAPQIPLLDESDVRAPQNAPEESFGEMARTAVEGAERGLNMNMSSLYQGDGHEPGGDVGDDIARGVGTFLAGPVGLLSRGLETYELLRNQGRIDELVAKAKAARNAGDQAALEQAQEHMRQYSEYLKQRGITGSSAYEERQEQYPVASNTGEVAGIIGSSFGSGAALPLRGASLPSRFAIQAMATEAPRQIVPVATGQESMQQAAQNTVNAGAIGAITGYAGEGLGAARRGVVNLMQPMNVADDVGNAANRAWIRSVGSSPTQTGTINARTAGGVNNQLIANNAQMVRAASPGVSNTSITNFAGQLQANAYKPAETQFANALAAQGQGNQAVANMLGTFGAEETPEVLAYRQAQAAQFENAQDALTTARTQGAEAYTQGGRAYAFGEELLNRIRSRADQSTLPSTTGWGLARQYGGSYAFRAANRGAAHVLDGIEKLLRTNPQSLGDWYAPLKGAADKGNLAAAVMSLHANSAAFRQFMESRNKEESEMLPELISPNGGNQQSGQ